LRPLLLACVLIATGASADKINPAWKPYLDLRVEARLDAVRTLGLHTHASDLRLAVAALTDPAASVVRAARDVLQQNKGPVAFRELIAALPIGDQYQAALLLAEYRGPNYLGKLATLLESPNPDVRRSLALALGVTRSPRVTTLPREALNDSSPNVGGDIRGAKRANVEEASMRRTFLLLDSRDPSERACAIQVLGSHADRDAFGIILSDLMFDPSTEVQNEAAKALGHYADADHEARVYAYFSDPNPKVRAKAAHGLEIMRAAQYSDALVNGLRSDPSDEVRDGCAGALVAIGSVNLPRLQALSKDFDPKTRSLAADALGRLKASLGRGGGQSR